MDQTQTRQGKPRQYKNRVTVRKYKRPFDYFDLLKNVEVTREDMPALKRQLETHATLMGALYAVKEEKWVNNIINNLPYNIQNAQ